MITNYSSRIAIYICVEVRKDTWLDAVSRFYVTRLANKTRRPSRAVSHTALLALHVWGALTLKAPLRSHHAVTRRSHHVSVPYLCRCIMWCARHVLSSVPRPTRAPGSRHGLRNVCLSHTRCRCPCPAARCRPLPRTSSLAARYAAWHAPLTRAWKVKLTPRGDPQAV